MQTNFSPAQLADPDIRQADKILRACVHCGFCTSTCPTYALLGDERDSPRGRIYLIKDMLENDRPATAEVVKHIDRCLSCFSCMTACPSGVDYMHLVDHARAYIEDTYKRPWAERTSRRILGSVLSNPVLFRTALSLGRLAAPFSGWLPARMSAMLRLVPKKLPARVPIAQLNAKPRTSAPLRRVALLPGCAQQVLAPDINAATTRLLVRHGCEVITLPSIGCCGALRHHMGISGLDEARKNVLAWHEEIAAGKIDTIAITASGCGTTVKDYGFMFRNDPELKEKAAAVSRITRDISELLSEIRLLPPTVKTGQRVAYHSACSLQHGQRVRNQPKELLRQAGFEVIDIPEEHLCCGSAGTYNLLQPVLAGQLRERKVACIESTRPDIIATGNVGCMAQIQSGTHLPVVHLVQLLDRATEAPGQ